MIINLNRYRKKRRRTEAEAQAKENRFVSAAGKKNALRRCANASARRRKSKTSASTSAAGQAPHRPALAGCGKTHVSFRDGPSGPGPEPMNTDKTNGFSGQCSWLPGSRA